MDGHENASGCATSPTTADRNASVPNVAPSGDQVVLPEEQQHRTESGSEHSDFVGGVCQLFEPPKVNIGLESGKVKQFTNISSKPLRRVHRTCSDTNIISDENVSNDGTNTSGSDEACAAVAQDTYQRTVQETPVDSRDELHDVSNVASQRTSVTNVPDYNGRPRPKSAVLRAAELLPGVEHSAVVRRYSREPVGNANLHTSRSMSSLTDIATHTSPSPQSRYQSPFAQRHSLYSQHSVYTSRVLPQMDYVRQPIQLQRTVTVPITAATHHQRSSSSHPSTPQLMEAPQQQPTVPPRRTLFPKKSSVPGRKSNFITSHDSSLSSHSHEARPPVAITSTPATGLSHILSITVMQETPINAVLQPSSSTPQKSTSQLHLQQPIAKKEETMSSTELRQVPFVKNLSEQIELKPSQTSSIPEAFDSPMMTLPLQTPSILSHASKKPSQITIPAHPPIVPTQTTKLSSQLQASVATTYQNGVPQSSSVENPIEEGTTEAAPTPNFSTHPLIQSQTQTTHDDVLKKEGILEILAARDAKIDVQDSFENQVQTRPEITHIEILKKEEVPKILTALQIDSLENQNTEKSLLNQGEEMTRNHTKTAEFLNDTDYSNSVVHPAETPPQYIGSELTVPVKERGAFFQDLLGNQNNGYSGLSSSLSQLSLATDNPSGTLSIEQPPKYSRPFVGPSKNIHHARAIGKSINELRSSFDGASCFTASAGPTIKIGLGRSLDVPTQTNANKNSCEENFGLSSSSLEATVSNKFGEQPTIATVLPLCDSSSVKSLPLTSSSSSLNTPSLVVSPTFSDTVEANESKRSVYTVVDIRKLIQVYEKESTPQQKPKRTYESEKKPRSNDFTQLNRQHRPSYEPIPLKLLTSNTHPQHIPIDPQQQQSQQSHLTPVHDAFANLDSQPSMQGLVSNTQTQVQSVPTRLQRAPKTYEEEEGDREQRRQQRRERRREERRATKEEREKAGAGPNLLLEEIMQQRLREKEIKQLRKKLYEEHTEKQRDLKIHKEQQALQPQQHQMLSRQPLPQQTRLLDRQPLKQHEVFPQVLSLRQPKGEVWSLEKELRHKQIGKDVRPQKQGATECLAFKQLNEEQGVTECATLKQLNEEQDTLKHINKQEEQLRLMNRAAQQGLAMINQEQEKQKRLPYLLEQPNQQKDPHEQLLEEQIKRLSRLVEQEPQRILEQEQNLQKLLLQKEQERQRQLQEEDQEQPKLLKQNEQERQSLSELEKRERQSMLEREEQKYPRLLKLEEQESQSSLEQKQDDSQRLLDQDEHQSRRLLEKKYENKRVLEQEPESQRQLEQEKQECQRLLEKEAQECQRVLKQEEKKRLRRPTEQECLEQVKEQHKLLLKHLEEEFRNRLLRKEVQQQLLDKEQEIQKYHIEQVSIKQLIAPDQKLQKLLFNKEKHEYTSLQQEHHKQLCTQEQDDKLCKKLLEQVDKPHKQLIEEDQEQTKFFVQEEAKSEKMLNNEEKLGLQNSTSEQKDQECQKNVSEQKNEYCRRRISEVKQIVELQLQERSEHEPVTTQGQNLQFCESPDQRHSRDEIKLPENSDQQGKQHNTMQKECQNNQKGNDISEQIKQITTIEQQEIITRESEIQHSSYISPGNQNYYCDGKIKDVDSTLVDNNLPNNGKLLFNKSTDHETFLDGNVPINSKPSLDKLKGENSLADDILSSDCKQSVDKLAGDRNSLINVILPVNGRQPPNNKTDDKHFTDDNLPFDSKQSLYKLTGDENFNRLALDGKLPLDLTGDENCLDDNNLHDCKQFPHKVFQDERCVVNNNLITVDKPPFEKFPGGEINIFSEDLTDDSKTTVAKLESHQKVRTDGHFVNSLVDNLPTNEVDKEVNKTNQQYLPENSSLRNIDDSDRDILRSAINKVLLTDSNTSEPYTTTTAIRNHVHSLPANTIHHTALTQESITTNSFPRNDLNLVSDSAQGSNNTNLFTPNDLNLVTDAHILSELDTTPVDGPLVAAGLVCELDSTGKVQRLKSNFKKIRSIPTIEVSEPDIEEIMGKQDLFFSSLDQPDEVTESDNIVTGTVYIPDNQVIINETDSRSIPAVSKNLAEAITDCKKYFGGELHHDIPICNVQNSLEKQTCNDKITENEVNVEFRAMSGGDEEALDASKSTKLSTGTGIDTLRCDSNLSTKVQIIGTMEVEVDTEEQNNRVIPQVEIITPSVFEQQQPPEFGLSHCTIGRESNEFKLEAILSYPTNHSKDLSSYSISSDNFASYITCENSLNGTGNNTVVSNNSNTARANGSGSRDSGSAGGGMEDSGVSGGWTSTSKELHEAAAGTRLDNLLSAPVRPTPPKSPVTVQEWVASLPYPATSPTEQCLQSGWELPLIETPDGCGGEPDDLLHLGAEAHLLSSSSSSACVPQDDSDTQQLSSTRPTSLEYQHTIEHYHNNETTHGVTTLLINTNTGTSPTLQQQQQQQLLSSELETHSHFRPIAPAIETTVTSAPQHSSDCSTMRAKWGHWDSGKALDDQEDLNEGEDSREEQHQEYVTAEPASAISAEKRLMLSGLRSKQNSFASEVSAVSCNSRSSLESLLESRQQDAVEVLLNLGFGHEEDQDPLARIPTRFLDAPSKVPGNDLRSFLAQEDRYHQMLETNNWLPGLSYQGVRKASMSTSPLLANLLETFHKAHTEFEEEEDDDFDELPPNANKLATLVNEIRKKKLLSKRSKSAHNLGVLNGGNLSFGLNTCKRSGRLSIGSKMNGTSGWSTVLGALGLQSQNGSKSDTEKGLGSSVGTSQAKASRWLSVLTPENRDFLQSQGRKSPETVSRRLILGQASFDLGKNGEILNEQNKPTEPDDTENCVKTVDSEEATIERFVYPESNYDMSTCSFHKKTQRNASVWSMASSLTSIDSNEEKVEEERRLLNEQISRNRNNKRKETLCDTEVEIFYAGNEDGCDTKPRQKSNLASVEQLLCDRAVHKKLRRTSTPKRHRTVSTGHCTSPSSKGAKDTIEEEMFFSDGERHLAWDKAASSHVCCIPPTAKVALQVSTSLPLLERRNTHLTDICEGGAGPDKMSSSSSAVAWTVGETEECQPSESRVDDGVKETMQSIALEILTRRGKLQRQRTVRDGSSQVPFEQGFSGSLSTVGPMPRSHSMSGGWPSGSSTVTEEAEPRSPSQTNDAESALEQHSEAYILRRSDRLKSTKSSGRSLTLTEARDLTCCWCGGSLICINCRDNRDDGNVSSIDSGNVFDTAKSALDGSDETLTTPALTSASGATISSSGYDSNEGIDPFFVSDLKHFITKSLNRLRRPRKCWATDLAVRKDYSNSELNREDNNASHRLSDMKGDSSEEEQFDDISFASSNESLKQVKKAKRRKPRWSEEDLNAGGFPLTTEVMPQSFSTDPVNSLRRKSPLGLVSHRAGVASLPEASSPPHTRDHAGPGCPAPSTALVHSGVEELQQLLTQQLLVCERLQRLLQPPSTLP